MLDGYEEEDALTQEDINILDVNKSEAKTGDTTVIDASGKIKRTNLPSTPLQV